MSKLLMVAALAIFTTLWPAFAVFDPNRIVSAVDYVAQDIQLPREAWPAALEGIAERVAIYPRK